MTWYNLALISALLISLYEISEKKALLKEHSYDFLAAFSFIMLVLSLPLLLFGNIQFVDRYNLLLIFIGCVFTVSLYVLATRALRHLDVSEYSPLMNLSPLFLFIISWIFLGELPSLLNIFGIVMIVFGAYFLEIRNHDWLGPIKRIQNNKYVQILLLGIIFASLSALMDKVILSNGVNVDTFYFYKRVIVALILVFISSFFFKGYKDIILVYKRSFIWVLLAGIFYMLADYTYFIAVAMPATLVSLIIPVKRVSTAVSTLLGGESFHEKHIPHKVVACLVMVLGVFLIVQ
jgi:uncharacterized membrane protein